MEMVNPVSGFASALSFLPLLLLPSVLFSSCWVYYVHPAIVAHVPQLRKMQE
jgi:hypothetical protein